MGSQSDFQLKHQMAPEADEYTCYGNYSDQRWKDAAEAGAAFFTELKNGTNTN